MAKVDVGSDNTITVTVPHLDGAGAPQTVFKGSQRPYNKEYVLIFDKTTGDITLEKLTANIQVKKTRYVYYVSIMLCLLYHTYFYYIYVYYLCLLYLALYQIYLV